MADGTSSTSDATCTRCLGTVTIAVAQPDAPATCEHCGPGHLDADVNGFTFVPASKAIPRTQTIDRGEDIECVECGGFGPVGCAASTTRDGDRETHVAPVCTDCHRSHEHESEGDDVECADLDCCGSCFSCRLRRQRDRRERMDYRAAVRRGEE